MYKTYNDGDNKNYLYYIFDNKRKECKKVKKDYNDYVKRIEDNFKERVKHFWIHINKERK